MSRFARKVDSNHAEIVVGLRKLGVWVWDCSRAAGGGPDLLACYRGKFTPLEVKPPLGPNGGAAHSSLNPLEAAFHRGCPGRIPVVRSVEEAWAAIGGDCGCRGAFRCEKHWLEVGGAP